MPELIALRAVFGQDEANHGTTRYCVGAGLVQVPPEGCFLIGKGGFALAKTTAVVATEPVGEPTRTPCSLHHDDAVGCSYGGCGYPVDQNGDVLVPAPAAPI